MLTSFKSLAIALGVSAIILSLAPERCAAQISAGTTERPHKKVGELLEKLEGLKLQEIPKLFFDSLYNPDLPDLVIYPAEGGDVNICLTQGGKKKNELMGARDLWVMVLSVNESFETVSPETTFVMVIQTGSKEGKVVSDTLSTMKVSRKNESLKAELEAIDHKIGIGEHGLLSLVTAIPAALGVTVNAPGISSARKDTTVNIKLQDFGKVGGKTLFFGMQKLPLTENTINRISVRPLKNKDAFATFGNYSASRLAASIGTGLSWRESSDSLDTKTLPGKPEAEPFIFSHFYFKRPHLPGWHSNKNATWLRRIWSAIRPRSLSFAAGAKITTDHFLDDIFFGIGFGHIAGTGGGLIAGVNFTTLKGPDSRKFYRGEPLIGICYLL